MISGCFNNSMSSWPWSWFNLFFHFCSCMCMSVFEHAPVLTSKISRAALSWLSEALRKHWHSPGCPAQYNFWPQAPGARGPEQWSRPYRYSWKTQPFQIKRNTKFPFLWLKGENQKVPGATWFSLLNATQCLKHNCLQSSPSGRCQGEMHLPHLNHSLCGLSVLSEMLSARGKTGIAACWIPARADESLELPHLPLTHTPAPGQPQSGHQ